MPTATITIAQVLLDLQHRGITRLAAQLLLLHTLGLNASQRSWLLAHDQTGLTPAQISQLKALAQRHLDGEPLAYLTGSQAFYGLQLSVSPAVLVPRPDTETLVDWALQVLAASTPSNPIRALDVGRARDGADCFVCASDSLQALNAISDSGRDISTATTRRPIRVLDVGTDSDQDSARDQYLEPLQVLDLGTGSGAIALAIKASRPALQVWACDSSPAALEIAQANAHRLGLALQLHQGHWFDALPANAPKFDCIAANPPYIAECDPHLPALRHEPRPALVSGSDGLDDLRHIISQAPAQLKNGGWLLLEHGFDQAQTVRQLLTQRGFTQVQSKRDLAEIERCSGGCWVGHR